MANIYENLFTTLGAYFALLIVDGRINSFWLITGVSQEELLHQQIKRGIKVKWVKNLGSMKLDKNQEHKTAHEYPSETHRLIVLYNLNLI